MLFDKKVLGRLKAGRLAAEKNLLGSSALMMTAQISAWLLMRNARVRLSLVILGLLALFALYNATNAFWLLFSMKRGLDSLYPVYVRGVAFGILFVLMVFSIRLFVGAAYGVAREEKMRTLWRARRNDLRRHRQRMRLVSQGWERMINELLITKPITSRTQKEGFGCEIVPPHDLGTNGNDVDTAGYNCT